MEPIESLKKIISDRGIGVLEHPDLVGDLMSDHCQGRPPEIHLLVSSLTTTPDGGAHSGASRGGDGTGP
ncbi:MAG: hypothetical protein ABSF22_16320 [Bryobacteraceae bacterium]